MIAENKKAEYIKIKKLRKFVKTQEYPQMILKRELKKVQQFSKSVLKTNTISYHLH